MLNSQNNKINIQKNTYTLLKEGLKDITILNDSSKLKILLDNYHNDAMKINENKGKNTGNYRRIIYHLSTNLNKTPEFEKVFNRYGIEVFRAPVSNNSLYINLILKSLNSFSENYTVHILSFVNEDNLPYVDVITDSENLTLFRVSSSDNFIIQRITCINIKGGPIPDDISELCKIFTIKITDPDSLTYIIGTDEEGVKFDIFNNLIDGNTSFSVSPDNTSLFVFTMRIPESANDFFERYQLKFTVYYTLT